MTPPLIRIREIELFERNMRFARPFRFGLVTVDTAPQAFVRVTVEIEKGDITSGLTAEMMMPKWFDKNPHKTPQDTIADLKASLEAAARFYADHRDWDTAFGHHACALAAQKRWAEAENLPGLVASFGAALIDKATVDAVLKALSLNFADGLRQNVFGIDARLTPDLDDRQIQSFLSGLNPSEAVALRHTIGLLDAIEGADGLEGELAEARLRLFKIKIGGDVEADIARLLTIHELLSRKVPNYQATLDANEQYDIERLKALLDVMEHGRLQAFRQHLLYVEQPLDRAVTFATPLGTLADNMPFIIDEADGDYDAFPKATSLGYRGVSSKACKGLYKSILNSVRASALNGNETGRFFVSAEDLTCQAGLGIQQDTALIAAMGLSHAERNGHHYVEGFGPAPEEEAARFASAHPDLYRERHGRFALATESGFLPAASLFAAPGFASGAEPDWSNLTPIQQHPFERRTECLNAD